MLDISVSYNRFAFLGYEFLTWLWFMIDQDAGALSSHQEKPVFFDVGNRIVIENRMGSDALETITIKGDDAGLEEAILALRKGAQVSEMNLFYREADSEWQFTIKGESLHLASLKTPKTGLVTNGEDVEGALLEKTYLYEGVITAVRTLYRQFINIRLSEEWGKLVVPRMQRWIGAEKPMETTS
ncbi:MAG: hypothetical protein ABIL58_13180 [Pseudomonadota bacterium]